MRALVVVGGARESRADVTRSQTSWVLGQGGV